MGADKNGATNDTLARNLQKSSGGLSTQNVPLPASIANTIAGGGFSRPERDGGLVDRDYLGPVLKLALDGNRKP
jgi:hypothetical protein